MIFQFKASEVAEIWRHAKASKDFSGGYGKSKSPGLLLVKDQGVYLMSNGRPGLSADPNDENSPNKVAYADGHNPHTDEFDDWYVGGDAFVECLDDSAAFFDKVLLEKPCKVLTFNVTSKHIKFSAK